MHPLKATKTIALAGILIVGYSASALSEARQVKQAGRAFSEDVVVISKGDSVTFVNDDKVPHNVYTNINGKKVDIGVQKPGETAEIVFDEAGDHQVRCAIHPKMRMTVKVD